MRETRGLHEASRSPSDSQLGSLIFLSKRRGAKGTIPGRHQCSTPSPFRVNSFKCGLPGMGRRGNWREEVLGRWQQVLGMP